MCVCVCVCVCGVCVCTSHLDLEDDVKESMVLVVEVAALLGHVRPQRDAQDALYAYYAYI